MFTSAVSAGNIGKELREINQSSTAIDSASKSGALPSRSFAVLSVDQPNAWVEYPTETSMETAAPKGFLRRALVYFQGPSPILVSLELKSPSKDWVQYLRYYFREDGTLEKINIDFRRFGAYEEGKSNDQQFLVKVLRDRFYDPRGKCIKKSKARCFNMSTGAQVRDAVFTDEAWPSYARLDQLPFFPLIQAAVTPVAVTTEGLRPKTPDP